MGFGDLKSRSGLETLNKHLEDKSYIEGYVYLVCPLFLYDILEGKTSTPRAEEIFTPIRSITDL